MRAVVCSDGETPPQLREGGAWARFACPVVEVCHARRCIERRAVERSPGLKHANHRRSRQQARRRGGGP
jgi:hypothetical protein